MYNYYLADKTHPLPSWYVPADLVEAPLPFDAPVGNPKRLICAIAYDSLKQMYLDSLQEGLSIYGISGYRSYLRQKEIYEESISNRGLEHTKKYIAAPGTSEHQTGLAIDLSSPDLGFDLIEEFADTNEGIWIKKNAGNYGFRISYPKGMEHVTGFAYEPWHIFYIRACPVYFSSI